MVSLAQVETLSLSVSMYVSLHDHTLYLGLQRILFHSASLTYNSRLLLWLV